MRIADLNASRGDDWPKDTKIATPVVACIIPCSNDGCYFANFSTLGISHSRICEVAMDYWEGHPNAFTIITSIDNPYVHGVFITYDIPMESKCGPT